MKWQNIGSMIEDLFKSVFSFFRYFSHVGSPIGLAAILFFLGYTVFSWFPDELKIIVKEYYVLHIFSGLCYVTGSIFLTIVCWRLWNNILPPPLPPDSCNRSNAIKGPMAFTPEDGDLFRKLGREKELQELMGYVLNDQVPIVVVMGESGAGKTSLLRAGLSHSLENKDIDYHYWEVTTKSPKQALLNALGGIQDFEELINPSSEFCPRRKVIILDQFEQFQGRKSSHNPIFKLLRQVARDSSPPHSITFILAFNREYFFYWYDDYLITEHKKGFFPPDPISVKLFKPDEAHKIISILCDESGLQVERKVVDNLVQASTVAGTVSPVEIGIGLMIISELAKDSVVTNADYRFAGGTEGILSQYIQNKLSYFVKSDQEKLLLAMLALRAPETNQRLGNGLALSELVRITKADSNRMPAQLERLAQRDIRLLERIDDTGNYRLSHERLIPSLLLLCSEELAEVDQIRLKFESAYLAWQNNGKHKKYLLSTNELKMLTLSESKIHWSSDVKNKQQFLKLSKKRHTMLRIIWGIGLCLIIGVSLIANHQYYRAQALSKLRDNYLPTQLYDHQHKLQFLKLQRRMNLEHFIFIDSDSIHSLDLEGSNFSISGISQLANCESLEVLSLNLAGSEVTDLQPLEKLSGLTHLVLNLDRCPVSDLQPLEKLSGLTHLKLDFLLSNVTDLQSLEKLSGLTHLELDLEHARLKYWPPLQELPSLTHLTLYLSEHAVSDLPPLEGLSSLTHLKLDLSSTSVSDLQPLEKLSGLTHLALDMSDSDVSDLKPLEKLSGLTHLTLNLARCQVKDLPPLEKLSGLTHLTLDLNLSEVKDLQPLEKLSDLTHLTLDLTQCQVKDLQPLEKLSGLTHLTLDLNLSEVKDLQPLEKLSDLTHLTLDFQCFPVGEFLEIEKLSNLTHLRLGFSNYIVNALPPLEKFSDLTHLTLEFSSCQIKDLQPLEKLSGLTHLELVLYESPVNNLQFLNSLKNIESLYLWIPDELRKTITTIPPSVTNLAF